MIEAGFSGVAYVGVWLGVLVLLLISTSLLECVFICPPQFDRDQTIRVTAYDILWYTAPLPMTRARILLCATSVQRCELCLKTVEAWNVKLAQHDRD